MTQPHQGWVMVGTNNGAEPGHALTFPSSYYIVDQSTLSQYQGAPTLCEAAGPSVSTSPPKMADHAPVVSTSTEHCSVERGSGDGAIHSDGVVQQQQVEVEEEAIDITINNVVGCFSTRCHLNLKRIAQEGMNVIYRRECGMVSMKLRKPYTTASIWSSGKITCTGATSEADSHVAGRRFARLLQQLGFRVRFANFRIVNVLGTCSLPFGIRIQSFSNQHKEHSSYEPELHPGVTYKIKSPKATLKIFSTGSITVTAPSVQNIQTAIEHIFPLVSEFKMEKCAQNTGYLHMMPRPKVPRTTLVTVDSDDSLSYETDESCD